jgi:hypothetical protein
MTYPRKSDWRTLTIRAAAVIILTCDGHHGGSSATDHGALVRGVLVAVHIRLRGILVAVHIRLRGIDNVIVITA